MHFLKEKKSLEKLKQIEHTMSQKFKLDALRIFKCKMLKPIQYA